MDRRLCAACPAFPTNSSAPDGRAAPHWRRLLQALARAGPEEIAQRFAARRPARPQSRHVLSRAAAKPNERAWPLEPHAAADRRSRMARDRARRRAARRTVRARARRRLRRGPAGRRGRRCRPRRVAGSTDFCRRCAASRRRAGAGCSLYAADIGRGPDGRWWVLGDRAQAPSGAGYALENRLVVSRALPNLYRQHERRAPRAVLPRAARRARRRAASAASRASAC